MLLGGPGFGLILVAMLLAAFAQIKVRSAYQKYSLMRVVSGRNGGDVARDILRRSGLTDVEVEPIQGVMSDHYDPRERKVRLSRDVYYGSSVASLGIAAHETGHALQHHEQYFPLSLRSSILPVAAFGSNLAFPLFFIGLLFNNPLFMDLGIYFFAGAVLFQIITLPVEFNASQRAVSLLNSGGYVTREEEGPVRDMLRAAGYTYLAATAVSLAHFLRLLLLRGNRRR